MYINRELTNAMPLAHRFLEPKSAAAKRPRPTAAAAASGLSRVELRKIIIELIG
jgi:hypothetical protein